MKRQLTLQEYRAIDLTLFAMILVLFEFIIVKVSASNLFWDQQFTVSLAAAITSIVYMRWGWWGGLHAALAGVLYCLYCGGGGQQYIIYTLGNLFSLLAVLPLKKLGPERVRTGRWSGLLFPLAVILLMQLGRMAVALVLGTPIMEALGFIGTDPGSVLFTLVIAWIVRRLDGVYEDQKHYLLRIQQEEDSQ